MNRFYNTITNTRGDSLPGHQVRVLSSTGTIVDIFSDASGTPIANDTAIADGEGLVEFYWTAAAGQLLQVLDTSGTLVQSIADFANNQNLANAYGTLPLANIATLGTFTGVTIPNDSTIKQGLQALETELESVAAIADANATPFDQSQLSTILWDDFDSADGAIDGRATPVGGATWEVSGPGAAGAQIIGGAMYGDEDLADSNFYAQIEYGEQITSVSGICRFEQRDIAASAVTGRGPQIVLIADVDGTLDNMLHFQINQNGWVLDTRFAATWDYAVDGGLYWMEPGADYLCQLLIDRDTDSYRCRISGSEGKLVDTGWVEYAGMSTVAPMTKAVWQIQTMNKTANAFKPSWRAVAVGPYKRNGSPVNFGDGGPVPPWNSGQPRFQFEPIEATVNTYWSLVEAIPLSVFAIVGTLHVQAVSAAGAIFNGSYRVLNTSNNSAPIIEPLSRELAFGNIPISIRASNDSDEARIDIAFTSASSDNVTAYIVYEGDGQPANFNRPKSGVSALASNSSVYVPTPPTTPDVASLAVSASGWYSIIQQSPYAAGGAIQGFFEVIYQPDNDALPFRAYLFVDQVGLYDIKPIMVFPMGPYFLTVEKIRISKDGTSVRVDIEVGGAAYVPGVITVRRLAGEGVLTVASVSAVLSGGNVEQTLAFSSPEAEYWDGTTGLKVAGTKVIGTQGAAVADASGGSTVDTEARTAINTLLSRLRTHGLIAT